MRYVESIANADRVMTGNGGACMYYDQGNGRALVYLLGEETSWKTARAAAMIFYCRLKKNCASQPGSKLLD